MDIDIGSGAIIENMYGFNEIIDLDFKFPSTKEDLETARNFIASIYGQTLRGKLLWKSGTGAGFICELDDNITVQLESDHFASEDRKRTIFKHRMYLISREHELRTGLFSDDNELQKEYGRLVERLYEVVLANDSVSDCYSMYLEGYMKSYSEEHPYTGWPRGPKQCG